MIAMLWIAMIAGASAAQQDPPSLAELSTSFEELALHVTSAVVQISATGLGVSQEALASGRSVVEHQEAAGSGVIVDPSGYIITNGHVVDGATRLQVMLSQPAPGIEGSSTLAPQGEVVEATLAGIDRETDIAVLKIEREGLPFLEFADSERVRPGQIVFAFGSPLGLANSVTMGVVSATARQLRPEDPMIYIQTDAAVNPGNSGGPLVDTAGDVVGINTLILSRGGGSEGIGFAAPSHIVRSIYEQLRDSGRVNRGVIGASVQTITPVMAAGLGLSQIWGVIVSDVQPRSPAQAAGLRVADIVQTLDGKRMENGRQFDVNVYRTEAGETVSLGLLRGEQLLTVNVRVIERRDYSSQVDDRLSPGNIIAPLGVYAIDLSEVADFIPGARLTNGIVVAAETAAAALYRDRFSPGDIIHEVNGVSVTDIGSLRAMLAGFDTGSPIVFQIERLGQFMYVAFEVDW